MITRKHAEQLDLELIESSNTLTLNTFSGELKTTSIKTTIPISSTLKIAAFVVKNNITLDRVHFNFKTTWPGLEKELYDEVKRNIAYGKLDAVIGIDQLYSKFSNGRTMRHPTLGLELKQTYFGWSVGGSLERKDESLLPAETNHNIFTSIAITTEPTYDHEDDEEVIIQSRMSRLFTTEEEEGEGETKFSAEEQYALDQFKQTIEFNEGQYFVKPIFKRGCIPLLNNYNLALDRYRKLRYRLSKNPELRTKYSDAINTLIKNEEVEKVEETPLEASEPGRVVYYLPHLPVVNEQKTSTKVRPVFDGSAKNHQGVSLNDQLLAGPKTQRSISTLMLHLRLNPIVVVCDVVRMFYSINYNEQPEGLMDGLTNNKDLFRFLWRDDDNVEPDVYRFRKVLMGSKTSPFQANSVILHHVEKMIKETDDPLTIECCELLQKFVYIDDILLGLTDEDKAIQVIKEVRRIFRTMNMELSKFVSNSIKVLKEIKKDDLAKEENDTESVEISKPTKVLGTMWDPNNDTLSFPYTKLLDNEIEHTKRGISKIIPSIYDINGEIAPFILRGKVILSMAWAYDKSEGDHATIDDVENEEKETPHGIDDSNRDRLTESSKTMSGQEIEEFNNDVNKHFGLQTTDEVGPESKDNDAKNNTKANQTVVATKRVKMKKPRYLSWDESLPPHIDALFTDWLKDIELINEFRTNRYLFGKEDGEFVRPPSRDQLELHIFSDGGLLAYGIVVFIRFPSKEGGYKMRRIFATSRIISPKNNMSVPRRELNGLVLAAVKAKALREELEIPEGNVFIHTDSIICMYWLIKPLDKLATYVFNRVKAIKDAGVDHNVFYTASEENVADLVTKVKPLRDYINNSFWDEGPTYLKDEEWKEGRSIKEIHALQKPSESEEEEIEKEVKKNTNIRANFIRASQVMVEDNIVSAVMKRSNDLAKVVMILRRSIHAVLKFRKLIGKNKPAPQKPVEGGDSVDVKKTNQFVWAMYQRRWYVAEKVHDIDKLPPKLKKCLKEGSTPVKFLRDGLYSVVKKVEEFGINDDIDTRRSKTDLMGYNIAITAAGDNRPVDECDDTESSNQPEEAQIPNDENHNDNPIMRFILENFEVQDNTNATEYRKLLNLIAMNDQMCTFALEYSQLEAGDTVDKESVLFQLNPYLCEKDRVIKMNSRLSDAELLPEQTKFPIILAKDSPFGDLVIMKQHTTNAHAGPQATHRSVRTQYWIVGGKRKVASVIRTCMQRHCIKQRAKAIIQDAPPLPKQRFEAEVFTCISADGMGPFEIKVENVCHFKAACNKCHKEKTYEEMQKEEDEKKCKTKKVYIVIFTCLSSRNINLELLQDRSTESFLMAFQRHCSENSFPKFILTDQAPEYKREDMEIQKVLKKSEVQTYMAEKGIRWQFTPANSAQHNSITESLVKQSKLALYGTFKDVHMTESEFNTALKIAQGKMNQRPLVAISDDPEDQNLLTLTPAHLKLGKALMSLPSDFDKVDDVANLSLKSRWEQRKRLQRKFFLRFKDEYLLNLSKLHTKQTKNVVIKQGDVVLLLDEKGSRDAFPIARVAKTFKGPDGIVRSVELKLPIKFKATKKRKKHDTKNAANELIHYSNKAKTIHRGVEKIAHLEGNPSVEKEPEVEDEEDQFDRTNGTYPSIDHGGGSR